MQARIFGACPKGTVEVVENVFFRGHQSTELFSSVETCVCVCVCLCVVQTRTSAWMKASVVKVCASTLTEVLSVTVLTATWPALTARVRVRRNNNNNNNNNNNK